MTDLEVSVSAKLAVIWIFNTRVLLGTRPNLGFNMICFIFLMKILNIKNHPFLHCMPFTFFYPKINI